MVQSMYFCWPITRIWLSGQTCGKFKTMNKVFAVDLRKKLNLIHPKIQKYTTKCKIMKKKKTIFITLFVHKFNTVVWGRELFRVGIFVGRQTKSGCRGKHVVSSKQKIRFLWSIYEINSTVSTQKIKSIQKNLKS